MCVYSMVMDNYQKRIPEWWLDPAVQPWQQPAPVGGGTITISSPPPTDEQRKLLDEMRTLIAEFKEALKAAKIVDRLTKQPDCEDPEKAKLVNRVAELERRLTALEPVKTPSSTGRIGRIKNPRRPKML